MIYIWVFYLNLGFNCYNLPDSVQQQECITKLDKEYAFYKQFWYPSQQ